MNVSIYSVINKAKLVGTSIESSTIESTSQGVVKAGAFAFVSLYQQTQRKDGVEELQYTAQARTWGEVFSYSGISRSKK